jgi:hypothetical protein
MPSSFRPGVLKWHNRTSRLMVGCTAYLSNPHVLETAYVYLITKYCRPQHTHTYEIQMCGSVSLIAAINEWSLVFFLSFRVLRIALLITRLYFFWFQSWINWPQGFQGSAPVRNRSARSRSKPRSRIRPATRRKSVAFHDLQRLSSV